MWEKCRFIDEGGSEGGIVLLDDEYQQLCRITLEFCGHYYAITCGVYGDMVHTVYGDKTDYLKKYNAVKEELENFMKNVYKKGTLESRSEFYEYLVNKY